MPGPGGRKEKTRKHRNLVTSLYHDCGVPHTNMAQLSLLVLQRRGTMDAEIEVPSA